MDTKRVFHTLDGLRGVTAICVALHHRSNWPIGFAESAAPPPGSATAPAKESAN